MAIQIQFRRGTASQWTSANPTLAEGEMGIETDTDLFKIGDGSTAWTSLAYGGIQGADGADGPAGADGAAGATGDTGPAGPAGTFSTEQVIENKSANYTLTSADAGKFITNSQAITITVQGIEVGKQVDFFQNVSGQITFAAGAGTTLNSRAGLLKTAVQYSAVSVKCLATNSYVLIGDLGA
jgi:hypothetical protein